MRLNAWPNLFIVGAPRCGTTTLHDVLGQHPDIFMSRVKEPHFLSSYDFPAIEREVLGVINDSSEYLRLFEAGQDRMLRGESSSYYLSDPHAATNIRSVAPGAKVIVILRDPIERAFSHYLIYERRAKQRSSFLETITEQIENPRSISPIYNLVELGRYASHLKRYFSVLPRSQVKVLLFEEFFSDSRQLSQTLGFLGVPMKQGRQLATQARRNPYAVPRNKLSAMLLSNERLTKLGLRFLDRRIVRMLRYSLLLKSAPKPTIEQEAKDRLIEVYEREIEQLEELLGRNMPSLRSIWS